MDANQLLDELAKNLAPRLAKLQVGAGGGALESNSAVSSDYDEDTCGLFLNGHHVGDSVLLRAEVFFGRIAAEGEVNSKELVAALGLKGPTSIPANLTNSLKKSARRLDIDEPWTWAETPDGTSTIWRDRDGIAARMMAVIAQEKVNRELG